MADFQIEDIIELLEHKNYDIVLQVVDIVVSSEDCLKDRRVISRLIDLLSVKKCIVKVATVLAHASGEYGQDSFDTKDAKRTLSICLRFCFDDKICGGNSDGECRNLLLALMANITITEEYAITEATL